MKQTIGGDRLGSGSKMQVDLKTYERSTHDLSYLWRSTMAAGTLVPFLSELALPGDTFDIELDCLINTHPTIGPLFGSFKIQLDLFQCPIRLYHRALHNNKLGIGMNMNTVKLPQIELQATKLDYTKNLDNQQINPSALLSYLNIRGIGNKPNDTITASRTFCALPYLSYWDIYKNYYANKQEEIGAFINSEQTVTKTITLIGIGNGGGGAEIPLPELSTQTIANITLISTSYMDITFTGTDINLNGIKINLNGTSRQLLDVFGVSKKISATEYRLTEVKTTYQGQTATYWRYITNNESTTLEPKITTFPLSNIDDMRDELLIAPLTTPYTISYETMAPYGTSLKEPTQEISPLLSSQEGLALKTYQSDLFNNWMQTEWIDGPNGINEITAIDVSDGTLKIDALILSRKVYDMLNRVAISGGSYNDWIEVQYTHEPFRNAESPIYEGGLIKELVFEEVVSNSQSTGEDGAQPLGTLAGKGKMGNKHKGGKATIRVSEPSYIMGIISLTPRVDYSQGNKWDVHLKTMDDLHKPALDEIGFQDLITEQMAWWDTHFDDFDFTWKQKSAGKQPAWLNYMTNVNQVRGNFAIEDNEMFMTLNRRYEHDSNGNIKDLTTYIDPVKFNQIFAQTARDAQNFWVQVGVNITARRKLSAKLMPNL